MKQILSNVIIVTTILLVWGGASYALYLSVPAGDFVLGIMGVVFVFGVWMMLLIWAVKNGGDK